MPLMPVSRAATRVAPRSRSGGRLAGSVIFAGLVALAAACGEGAGADSQTGGASVAPRADGGVGGAPVAPRADGAGGASVAPRADGVGGASGSSAGVGGAAAPPPAAGTGGAPVPACGGQCSSYGAPVTLGLLSSRLPELSGLAPSHRHPGLLYTHNDSGDSARFFAMDLAATVVAEVDLPGATALDWEAISVGACPAGTCVYVGDIGDGGLVRDGYTIYRVPEPETLPADGSAISAASYERFPFVYPDGRHNAEALVVHPLTGQVFVIIKEGGNPSVYEMPLPLVADRVVTLKKVATLGLGWADGVVTDAAFHPCGSRLLVRTSETLYELAVVPGAGVLSLFAAPPGRVPVAVEPQGEGVTYALDGTRYFTSSETGASPQPLSAVGCAAP